MEANDFPFMEPVRTFECFVVVRVLNSGLLRVLKDYIILLNCEGT